MAITDLPRYRQPSHGLEGRGDAVSPRPCSCLRRETSAGEPQSAEAAVASARAIQAIQARAAVEIVVARVSTQLVGAAAAEHPIGATAAREDVGRPGSAQRVSVTRADETFDRAQPVVSLASGTSAGQVGHDPGARAPEGGRIRSVLAAKIVVAEAAVELVIAGSAIQLVVPCGAQEDVIAA